MGFNASNAFDIFVNSYVLLFYSYAIKAFAMLLSSFEEVIWLDTDNSPMIDPEFLFDVPEYLNKHAMFWPDNCNFYTVHAAAYDVMGLPRPGVQVNPFRQANVLYLL